QLQRAKPGVEGAVAIAVAPSGALAAALVAPGANQPLDVTFHQQLQHRLGHGSQKISIAGLLQQIGQHQSLFFHRALSRASGCSMAPPPSPPGQMATSTTPQPYPADRPENSPTSVDANLINFDCAARRISAKGS